MHANEPGVCFRYIYPTCDQLADSVYSVVEFFKLKSVVCFGIGLGANILARFTVSCDCCHTRQSVILFVLAWLAESPD
jgi:Ndr family